MLSPQRIERLRGYLIEHQASLRQQIAGLASAAQESHGGPSNHMAEDATATFDQETTVSLQHGHERTLSQVDLALERISDGTYGSCERCGGEIDFARLKAVPYASLCMQCQRLLEL